MKPEVERLASLAAGLGSDERAAFLAGQKIDARLSREVLEALDEADRAELIFDQAVRAIAGSLPVEAEPAPGDVIGGFRVISLIGRGGMGAVYLAERAGGEIRQRVALKVLRGDLRRAGWRERFLRERRLLATLQHASIVHLVDAGQSTDGRPYLAMEYVDGEPLHRHATRIGAPERLRVFLRVCEGVSHAHRRRIIHRDLKPSNILVDATGQPKLLDFGIAKLQDEFGDGTVTAEQWMTPTYASPEQLRGEAQTTATDVYSLGAVLHTLMIGSPPRRERRRPRADVPRDLECVIAKALRPEPEARYRSVDELADDVRAVLERRPVAARRGDWRYRARAFMRIGRLWRPVQR